MRSRERHAADDETRDGAAVAVAVTRARSAGGKTYSEEASGQYSH
jgi:hypothetical protein